jgi:hypothetical protein
VTVWSIQHAAVVKTLDHGCTLHGSWARVDPAFDMAYRWMCLQMHLRLGCPPPQLPPVWVWRDRPDLRRVAHLEPETPGVLLELDVDPEQVLWSDFDGWHFVLARDYVGDDRPEGAASDTDTRESWPRIFDLPAMAELFAKPGWVGPHHVQRVQGCVCEIQPADVVWATRFTAH